MIEIRLYKSSVIDLTIQFPQQWNECILSELKLIAGAIFLKKYTDQELLVQLLMVRIKYAQPQWTEEKIKALVALLSIEDLALNYQQLLAFIYDGIVLTTQPLKFILGMPGPADDFSSMACGEFEDAEFHLNQWMNCMNSKDEKLIANNLQHVVDLISILWRPLENKAITPYTNYIPWESTKSKLSGLQPELLYVCLLWFMGCKAQLPASFPFVYNSGSDGVIVIGNQQPDTLAFTKLIHHGAGPKNGTRSDIRKMPVREFLFDLNLEGEKQPANPTT